MKQARCKVTSEFKTKAALEALSERLTLTKLVQKHESHPSQITQGKRKFLDKVNDIFSKGEKAERAFQQENENLFKIIGQMKTEYDG
ncbi:MAG: hypothetical protein K9G39_10395 [Chlorobium sp.]|uniref:hypothetical protein n=1 Tax=Chlorobium sp. TaxID=1095 RepID=UPI0025C26556|nr:hypothetical protein [Chlorobium sp.]MCF8383976.1 hypothetical protein [Chlorobium sp.]